MSKIEIWSIPVGVCPLASWSSPIPHSVVLRTCELEVYGSIPARPIFFPRIDDSHCNEIHSSLTVVRCFDNGYVRNQQVVWKEYCAEYWLKELQESTCRHAITEILLKTALNTINLSINHLRPYHSVLVSYSPFRTIPTFPSIEKNLKKAKQQAEGCRYHVNVHF